MGIVGQIPWNKGRKGLQVAWNKGKKLSNLTGENACAWKGGIKKHQRGYNLIYNPIHPFCTCEGYVFEHRLIIEKQIGRYLHRWEVVHHKNKILDDNRIDNLELFPSQGEHLRQHKLNRIKSEV